MPPGLIVAAPASGSGKTTVTLGLLRALYRRGTRVGACKAGPDYIDPMFHAAARGGESYTLDTWCMRPAALAGNLQRAGAGRDLVVVEGVMGLFDGAPDGRGSTADLAAWTGWPVILVVDAARQAQSVAALVAGFRDFRADIALAGVILNRVGGPGHADILRRALAQADVPVLGALPRDDALALPERHLGLVPAGEHGALESFLEAAADAVERHLDMDALRRAAAGPAADGAPVGPAAGGGLPPPGRRVAVAGDAAFCFAYPHMLAAWREAGATVRWFSPLRDEAPPRDCDAVFLPGGYPELHARRLAACRRFRDGMAAAAEAGCLIYGECGGYMVLGRSLVDGDGEAHAMLGLLALSTSFAGRRLHLGYRTLRVEGADGPFPGAARLRGHEFHYARILHEAPAAVLGRASDAHGRDLGPVGARAGRVMGSFVHIVDRA